MEGGNDGVVILSDGTKYVSSVRFGSISHIDTNGNARLIAQEFLALLLCVMTRLNTNW